MGVHADGSGTYWTETSPDADQPHGLAYREFQDLRVGVRKRLQQEHVMFADATVGGNHIPGKVQCLGFNDGTGADLTKNFSDGSWFGHAPIWDTTSRLWCITCDNSYAGAVTPKKILLNPAKIWDDSIEWPNKEQQFTGAASFKGAVDISDTLSVCQAAVNTKVLSARGDVSFSSDDIDISVTNQLYLHGGLYCFSTSAAVVSQNIFGKGTTVGFDSSYVKFNAAGNPETGCYVQFASDATLSATYKMSVAGDLSFIASGANGALTCSTNNFYDSSAIALEAGVSYCVAHHMGTTRYNAILYTCCNAGVNTCGSSWNQAGGYYYAQNAGSTIQEMSTSHLAIVAGATGPLARMNMSGAWLATDASGWGRVVVVRL